MSDYIKFFSGTTIITNRLAFILDELGISSIIKDNNESGRLAGFGTLGQSVDLFIREKDTKEANLALDNFKKEIEK